MQSAGGHASRVLRPEAMLCCSRAGHGRLDAPCQVQMLALDLIGNSKSADIFKRGSDKVNYDFEKLSGSM